MINVKIKLLRNSSKMDFLADKTMTSNPWCPLWWETTGEEIPQECGDDRGY